MDFSTNRIEEGPDTTLRGALAMPLKKIRSCHTSTTISWLVESLANNQAPPIPARATVGLSSLIQPRKSPKQDLDHAPQQARPCPKQTQPKPMHAAYRITRPAGAFGWWPKHARVCGLACTWPTSPPLLWCIMDCLVHNDVTRSIK